MNKIYSKRRARKKCHRQFWPTWSSQFAPCPNQEIHLKFELNQSRLQWRSGPTRMKKAPRCHPTKGLHNLEGQIWSTLESSLPWTKTIGRERQWLTKQPARQKQNVFLFIHSLKPPLVWSWLGPSGCLLVRWRLSLARGQAFLLGVGGWGAVRHASGDKKTQIGRGKLGVPLLGVKIRNLSFHKLKGGDTFKSANMINLMYQSTFACARTHTHRYDVFFIIVTSKLHRNPYF